MKVKIEIIDMSESGEGIGKHEGLIVFVPDTVPGDVVECEIYEQKKNYAKARKVKQVSASKFRVAAPCPWFSQCGGCQLQELKYEAQLKFKTQLVEDALKRIGHFEEVNVEPIIGMNEPFRYRNKGFYQVQGTFQHPIIGFFKKNSHVAVDIEDCLLQDKQNTEIIKTIKHYMKEFKVSPYSTKTKEGTIKSVMIRKSESTGEIMVVIVTAGKKLMMSKVLADLLVKANAQIVSVIQNILPGQSMSGLGEENKCLYGKETITDRIGKLEFELSAHSFYQVNAKQTEVMYQKALEFAALTGTENVYELYSGTGTISLFLAQQAKQVYGVESVEEAVINARANAVKNNLSNVQFVLGKAEEAFVALYEEGRTADVVVVDPPRSGCDVAVLETILKMSPQRIVYVSCKPSTLARDLKILCESGMYQVKQVQPVDVFGQTTHVECVVKLEKR